MCPCLSAPLYSTFICILVKCSCNHICWKITAAQYQVIIFRTRLSICWSTDISCFSLHASIYLQEQWWKDWKNLGSGFEILTIAKNSKLICLFSFFFKYIIEEQVFHFKILLSSLPLRANTPKRWQLYSCCGYQECHQCHVPCSENGSVFSEEPGHMLDIIWPPFLFLPFSFSRCDCNNIPLSTKAQIFWLPILFKLSICCRDIVIEPRVQ